jgi:hypothetical protein
MRSSVVLPQPEGPSRKKSDPAGTSRSSESTATVEPNSRRSLSSRIGSMAVEDTRERGGAASLVASTRPSSR